MSCPVFTNEYEKKASAFESIGTKQEKTLHRAIKYYLCPDEQCHEFKIGRFIADIYQNGHVIEIQTGSFGSLKKKLGFLLPGYQITIVYPVIRKKVFRTIDEMGIMSPMRPSPKTGVPLSIGKELFQIKDYLTHPHLDFLIFLIDVEEYRTKTIVDSFRKPYDRIDQYPKGEPQIIPLKTVADYKKLLPEALPFSFTAEDFRKVAKVGKSDVSRILSVFQTLEILRKNGKVGRAFLYEKS